ncbi:ARF-GAP domain 5 [Actinidia rufa]|uniref:ARF-GAP domain 5 n=1 Tax=Actinidia rufa TaxID=165716 RepID=A0A7J0DNN2_9ERIC|nr:ARF-GAP domain 5 [Actinidia rufa]
MVSTSFVSKFQRDLTVISLTKVLTDLHIFLAVRSATLDTWLPEQVAYIQSMGNEKSNGYWEAELPPNYDRVGIENFIRAKYEEKRWVAKNSKPKSPPRAQEDNGSMHAQRPGVSSEGRKNFQAPSTRDSIPATRISLPVPPKGPESVTPAPKSHQNIQKSEPAVTSAESAMQVIDSSPVVSPPKVDYATDLFNMLSMDGPSENSSEAASGDDNAWAGFQSAAEGSTADKTVSTKADDNKTQSTSGIQDLFKRLAFTSTIYAKSAGVAPEFAGNAQQPGPNGTLLPTQNWPNVGYQFPGMTVPGAGNNEPQKYMQQMRNIGSTHPVGSSVPFPMASTYAMGPNVAVNGVAPAGTNRTPSPPPVSSAGSTQTGKEYDFSSLTQGMFSKS